MDAPLDPRKLQYFCEVAAAGSFSAAAERLDVAQSLLSRQIAVLERSLGVSLFERRRSGVALTGAGTVLLERARGVLAELDAIRSEVADHSAAPSGTVTVGFPFSMLHVVSAPVIENYVAQFPNVTMRALEGVGHEIEDWLVRGNVDVGILLSGRRGMREIETAPLASEPVLVVGHPGTGFGLTRPVPLSAVADQPFVALRQQNFVRMRAESELAKQNRTLNVVAEVEGYQLLLEMVRRGVGYTLVPRSAVEREIASGEIAGAPVPSMSVTWTLGVNRRRRQGRAVRELLGVIRRVAADSIANGSWRAVAVGNLAAGG